MEAAPSAGRFRPEIIAQMTQIVDFLTKNNAPITINIYPFLSLYGNDDFPLNYAFFDGAQPVDDHGISYTNVFDANFDTLVSSLKAVGHGDMPIVAGDAYRLYNGQGQNKLLVGAQNVTYLQNKWCSFNPEAKDLTKLAKNIDFACTYSDCTALGYGSSCNGLDANGNASYAFNMYFQVKNQDEEACIFQGGLSLVEALKIFAFVHVITYLEE
ncbi:unnamed protein product [Microthlaspi erraticum]|uniref:glucan endo-1,3-beta-D-glucosidase n=1 Tax=Microthlaspi erraticum TaxID=1685480 RepID=A0A6D2JGZ3_9BRAS|nr:unnamed protein product [Microthlaspi erraticum]CAA7040277.1 unnamed protein product [Microthlaspi erraticum]